MTRALLHARQHAAICNGLECAEPEPVDATRLREARERMALGVRVAYLPACECFILDAPAKQKRGYFSRRYMAARTPAEATRAYLALCASLSSSPASSLPDIDDAALAEAPASAFSSPSAPSVSPDPGAVAGEVPPIANASPASNPGVR